MNVKIYRLEEHFGNLKMGKNGTLGAGWTETEGSGLYAAHVAPSWGYDEYYKPLGTFYTGEARCVEVPWVSDSPKGRYSTLTGVPVSVAYNGYGAPLVKADLLRLKGNESPEVVEALMCLEKLEKSLNDLDGFSEGLFGAASFLCKKDEILMGLAGLRYSNPDSLTDRAVVPIGM